MSFRLSTSRIFFLLLFVCLAIVGWGQTGYTDLFSDNILNPGWGQSATAFTLSETNQETKVVAATSGYTNFYLTLPSNINVSANPSLKLKVKAASNFTLRVDLGDANGYYTNANPTSVAITGNNTYQTINLNFSGKFSQNTPSSATVDNTKIKSITFFLNAGSSFSGTIYLDNLILGDSVAPVSGVPGTISTNSIGYETFGTKWAVFQTTIPTATIGSFSIINTVTGLAVYTANPSSLTLQSVPGWKGRYFTRLDFSNFQTPGKYKIQLGPNTSYPFEIAQNVFFLRTVATVVGYFKAMRSTDTRDLTMGFFGGRTGTTNVYGGYTDAAGDPGKYFSHLSYANYFNPQHNPFVTWSLLKSFEQNGALLTAAGVAIQSEISWGADFLNRSLDATGYFYIGVFDDWGGSSNRQICEWSGSGGTRSANYQCAFREGAGMAIAALAKTAALNITGGTFSPQQCLQAATTAYAHLKSAGTGYVTKNLEYCNDHTENIIDDYTRLLAATELYKATKNAQYLTDAQSAANSILAKQNSAGWLYSDAALTRPFYHGVDEGLPVTAMAEYLAIDNSNAATIKTFFGKWLTWYAAITKEVYNPYNYVRAYAAPYTTSQQPARKGFFMPHNNETGYWWQGENARLGSMSAAFMNIARSLNSQYAIGTDSLSALAISQVDWIMGSNPFNTCFMFGVGQTNYPNYPASQPRNNMVGGICNGITAKDSDENDIDWKPFADTDWQNWRWIEQWLPHNGWYLVNASQMAYLNNNPPTTSPGVTANFGYSTNQLTVSFTNSSTGANLYTWSLSSTSGISGSFASGNSNSVNPIFTYTTSGNYLVCLTATSSISGSSSISCKSLTVCQPPVLLVNPLGSVTSCGTSLLTVNTSTGWSYQWLANGTPINGSSSPTFVASSSSIYTVSVTSFGCSTVSGNILLTISSVPGVLGAINGKASLCIGELANYSVPSINLPSIAYTWTVPSGWSIQSGQGNNSIALIAGSISGVLGVSPSNNCGVGGASFAPLTVNPSWNASVQIVAGSNSVCSGTGVTFTAVGLNAGTSPTYTWQVNGANAGTGSIFNYTPAQGDMVRAVLTVGGTLPLCLANAQATSTGISMTVNGLNFSSVSIASSNTTVCSGTGVSITASGLNAGTNPAIRWRVNGVLAGTGSTFSYTPNNGDYILAVQTVGGVLPTCLTNPNTTSNGITLTVNAIPSVPTFSTASVTYCQGAVASPLTASGTALLWYTNSVGGIGNSTAYTPTTSSQGTTNYYVSQTVASCESPRAKLTSIVYPIPSAPLTQSPVNLCQGSTAAGLNATGVNLQWYTVPSGGVASSSTIPSTSITGTTSYYVSQNVNGCESARSQLDVTVNNTIIASVSISSSATSVCSGAGVSFTASGVNTGSAPIYNWWVNGQQKANGSIFSYLPTNGDLVRATITVGGSTSACLTNTTGTSNGINLNVTSLQAASVGIISSAINVCSGTGIQFTATGINVGNGPIYTWVVNGTSQANGSIFNYIPSNNDVVRVIVNVGGTLPTCLNNSSATSTGLSLTVNSLQSLSIAAVNSSTNVCAGASVQFTATGINAGSTPSYSWTVNGASISNGRIFSYVPLNGDLVRAIVNVGGTLPNCLSANSATSSGVAISVTPNGTPSVSLVASAYPVCSGTGVIYTATPSNAGTSPFYKWTVNGTAQSSATNTLTYNPSQGDIIRALVTAGGTSGLCLSTTTAGSLGVTASVTGTLASGVSISASTNNVCQGQSVTFTSTAVGTGSSPTYQWLVNGNVASIAGPSFTFIPTSGNQVKVILTKGGTGINCITGSPATSPGLVISVTPSVSSSVSIAASATSVCSTLGISFTAAGINGGTNPLYSWKVNDVSKGSGGIFTYLPSDGDIVKAIMTASGVACLVSNPVTSSGLSIQVTSIGQSPCLLPTPSTISGSVSVLPNQSGVVYSVQSVAGVNYAWTVPVGASIVTGQGTNSITVNFTGSVGGIINLQESNNLGSSNASISISTAIPTTTNDHLISESIGLYPNPFSDQTFIQTEDRLGYEIIDLSGKILEKGTVHNGASIGGHLEPGTYIVLLTLEGSAVRKQVKLIKY